MDDLILYRRLIQGLGVLCVLYLGAGATRGQASATADPQDKQIHQSHVADATDRERIDPKAVSELTKMAAFLDRNGSRRFATSSTVSSSPGNKTGNM